MKELILEAWSNRELLKDAKYSDAVRAVIEEIDKGRLRVASPSDSGWQVNEWVKQAILMNFSIQQMKTYGSDIDMYGATNTAEFFAVISEYFFEQPQHLHARHPHLFEMLERIYKTNKHR